MFSTFCHTQTTTALLERVADEELAAHPNRNPKFDIIKDRADALLADPLFLLNVPWIYIKSMNSMNNKQLKRLMEGPAAIGQPRPNRPPDNSKFCPSTFAAPDAHYETTVNVVRHILHYLFGDTTITCMKVPVTEAEAKHYIALSQVMFFAADTADFETIWPKVDYRLIDNDEVLVKAAIKLIPTVWERLSFEAQKICCKTQQAIAKTLHEITADWSQRLPETQLWKHKNCIILPAAVAFKNLQNIPP